MRCSDLERWLDDGRPGAIAGRMHTHAAGCARCATAMRAADELEQALVRPTRAVAPGGFTSSVMRRVREAQSAPAAFSVVPLLPALAWWVRAAADPPVVLAFALTALLVGWRETLWTFAANLAARLAAYGEITLDLPGAASLTFSLPHQFQVFADPMVVLGLGLGALPAALWCGLWLYRRSERALAGAFLQPARARVR